MNLSNTESPHKGIIMKTLKFLILYALWACGFGWAHSSSSAMAATFAALHYSHMCQYHGVCHLFCESCPDNVVRLGVGGMYGQYADTEAAGINLAGGYINFYARGASPKERVQFVLDTHFGANKGNMGNFPVSADRSDTLGVFFEVRPMLGLNLLTQSFPLYLNIAYTFNLTNSDSGKNNTTSRSKEHRDSAKTHFFSASLLTASSPSLVCCWRRCKAAASSSASSWRS